MAHMVAWTGLLLRYIKERTPEPHSISMSQLDHFWPVNM